MMDSLQHDMSIKQIHAVEIEQGFVTSKGRYVSRKEGRLIQDSLGIESVAEGEYRGNELYSEDLY